MQQKTPTIEDKRDSMQHPNPRDKYRQKVNKKQEKNILDRIGIVHDNIDTIHACSNLTQYCSTNVDTKNGHAPQQKNIIPSDDPT